MRGWLAGAALCGLALGLGEQVAHADTVPGTISTEPSKVQFGSLAPVVGETGLVSWSIDGLGTTSASGTVQVQKPAGATVRRAFLAAASTGGSGFKIPDGGVSIDGTPINWDISTLSSISSWNHWSEVTSVVSAKINAAPAGLIDFSIGEANSGGIDGEVLAVIFDDPNQTTVNTAIFMFGAQTVSGDNFAVHLSDPLDLANPNLSLDFSLGIGFGYQPAGQFSIVKVNGTQMTQSAGGQDDGQPANGALLTVGGIGDTNANPPPAQPEGDPRTDDELYSLLPFVHTGDTTINVFTQNPSNDDNIFFAGLFVGDAAAIVGQGIVLGPLNATLNVGETETATATVQDSNGNPVANTPVTFKVNAGPNAGLTAVVNTDAAGHASFSYVGNAQGVDEISASFVDSTSHTKTSNTALRFWVVPNAPVCSLTAVIAGPPKQLQITVQNPNAGLQSIEVTDSTNADTVVPPFPLGYTKPLVITATKTDEAQGSHVSLTVTDVNGNVTFCDPVLQGESSEIGTDGTKASGGASCSIGAAGGAHGLAGMLCFGAVVGLALARRRRRA